MNTFTMVNEPQQPIEVPSVASESAQILESMPNHDPPKVEGEKKKKKKKKKTEKGGKKASTEGKKKKKKKKSTTKSNKDSNKRSTENKETKKRLSDLIEYYEKSGSKPVLANNDQTEKTASTHSSSTSSIRNIVETDVERQPQAPRRVSFGAGGVLASSNHNNTNNSLTIDYGDEQDTKRRRSARFLHTGEVQEYSLPPKSPGRRISFQNYEPPLSPLSPPTRRLSFLANSIKSFMSIGNDVPEHNPRDRSTGRRTAFAKSRGVEQNQNFRITKNLTDMKAEHIEAFFYNHGMEIALGVLYVALNILVGAHGAFQFTSLGGWTTDDDILRVTLPIARAGGRLVTLNCAILLLTACKYLWTCVRTYVAPVIPIGFPIDNIMPKYHRYVALNVIVSGCIIHTLPQIVNYATGSISIDHEGIRIWTFGDGYASKQLLLTGTLLTIIFSTFFVTTLPAFRKTAAGFRWFWTFHMGGIALAYPLLIIHGSYRGHPVFLYFALVPLILYLFDIAMRQSNISTTEILNWITHEEEGQQITELIIKCPKNFEYTPGQYVELNFPRISKREWHPFTVASAPNEHGADESEKKLVFYIKNSGKWTEALYDYASAYDLSKANKSNLIKVRGPHGAPAMNYFEYKHIVVIGSGVGVTPLLSIWKYLVAKGREMYDPDATEKDSIFSKFVEDNTVAIDMDMSESLKSVMEESKSKLQLTCIYLEKILESMTVSMSLLVLFILGETTTFVLQMFGLTDTAHAIGWILSFIVLAAHGGTIVVSSVAMGPSNYFKTFKSWIECAIIFADIIATIALSLSIKNSVKDVLGLAYKMDTPANVTYFLFFGLVVTLHAIRIFHIFYTTLKPTSQDIDDDEDSIEDAATKSLTFSHRSKGSGTSSTQEICSIDGILINRTYASMKFAARSLLRPIIEEGLDDLFSMEFYGTREKPKHLDRSEHGLITHMMGSQALGLDIRSAMCQHRHEEYFHSGRPNWNTVFRKAIAKAHKRNPEGGSVGVFFCGSPMIAKDLQAAAVEVTARHQIATKHLDGTPCKCKIIVHSENF